jgi:hypothetical protein
VSPGWANASTSGNDRTAATNLANNGGSIVFAFPREQTLRLHTKQEATSGGVAENTMIVEK